MEPDEQHNPFEKEFGISSFTDFSFAPEYESDSHSPHSTPPSITPLSEQSPFPNMPFSYDMLTLMPDTCISPIPNPSRSSSNSNSHSSNTTSPHPSTDRRVDRD